MTTTVKPPADFTSLDDTQSPLKLILKGPSGTGKTTKAALFPRPGILSLDNNLSSLKMLPPEVRKNIKIYNCTVDKNGLPVKGEKIFERFNELVVSAMNNPDLDSVVIDSLTTLGKVIENYVLKTTKVDAVMEIQDWRSFSNCVDWVMESLCTNPAVKKHVIFTAHESNVFDKAPSIGAAPPLIKIELYIPSKIKDKIELYFTDVWRTEKRNSPTGPKYFVDTRGNSLATAKCSIPVIGTKTIPDVFDWDLHKGAVLSYVNSILHPNAGTQPS